MAMMDEISNTIPPAAGAPVKLAKGATKRLVTLYKRVANELAALTPISLRTDAQGDCSFEQAQQQPDQLCGLKGSETLFLPFFMF